MIEFSDFSFRYSSQEKPTLKHIDLKIADGEKVLVIGPSGSGKSTLGNAINGLIPHSVAGTIEGSLKVSGIETKDSDIFSLSRKVGTVLQDTDGQFVGLSVAEDIAFSLENGNMEQARMKKIVLDTASLVEMKDFLSSSPGRLSGGQKQRVSIAGVLVDDVDILLFDEPLANLDPATGETAIRLIDRLHKETGKTIIIIEHRLEDVLICPVDRIVLIENGQKTLDATSEEILRSGELERAGIREPLYISALVKAGVDLGKEKARISDIDTFDPTPYRDRIISFIEEHRKTDRKPSGEEIIAFDDVSFSYDGSRDVLKHVTFSIREGEMCSVLGKNGAGKSTMAQLMMGIYRPDEGEIRILGKSANDDTISSRSRTIGYVMQNPNHMISNPMIYDEVAFALRKRGMDEERIKEKVLSALELCGLRKMWKWPISALSYGQKKRVTIASILVTDPKVLILDEPTAGQDYRHYTALMKFLKDVNRRLGITIIFVTHDMHLALEYTDRAIVMTDGVLLRDDTIERVFSDRELLRKANLKETSLFVMAERLGLSKDQTEAFISTFMQREDDANGKIDELSGKISESSEINEKVGQSKRRKRRSDEKSQKKFGFGLSYIDIESPIHSLCGVTKFLSFIIFIVFTLTTFDLRFLILALLLSLVALKLSRIAFRRFLPLMVAMLGIVSLNALFIYLFSPDQGSVYIGSMTVILGSASSRYHLTLEMLTYLVSVTLKYFTIFPIAVLFVFTTHPSEFASSLNKIGISYRISYAVSLTLRYIPELTDDYQHILHAQMARGVDISKNVKLRERILNIAKILGPLVLSSIDRIDVISNAMVLRGFGKERKRSWYMARKLRAADWAVIATLVLLISSSLVSRFVFGTMFYYPF